MPATIPWETVASLSTPRVGPAVTADLAGRIYAAGGVTGPGVYTATVERFDPSTGAWSGIAPMPTARAGAVAATDSLGRIYVIGGKPRVGFSTAVERFDPGTGVWTTLASLPTARTGATAAVSGGLIYVIGGKNRAAAWVGTVERFDPASGVWSTVASMPTGRSDLAAAVDSFGRIYAMGGLTGLGGDMHNTVERFDPSTGAWAARTPLPTGRLGLAAAADTAGRVYAIGGEFDTSGSLPLSVVERIDPLASSWTTVTSMQTARFNAGAAFDLQGRFYVVGGQGPSGSRLATVERGVINDAPNAPTLTTPTSAEVLDQSAAQVFSWLFSDPNPGDIPSAYELHHKLVGSGPWTSTGTVASTSSSRLFPGGTFAVGDYEWQVRTADSLGMFGPFSASGFFSAAVAPPGPSITAPVNGVASASQEVAWSSPDQDAYQIRRVADLAGGPDTSTVYYDTGEVPTSGARSRFVQFPTNNRPEHVQLRVKFGGLWSPWVSVRALVAYTTPAVPSVSVLEGSPAGAISVQASHPSPLGAQPTVVAVDVWRRRLRFDDGVFVGYDPAEGGELGISLARGAGLAPSDVFIDGRVTHRAIYEYAVWASGDNNTGIMSAWQAGI